MLLWIKLHRWKVKYLFRRSNSYFFCFNSTNNLQFSTAPPFPMCIALWEQHTKKSTYFIVCILSGLIILHSITFFFFVFFCFWFVLYLLHRDWLSCSVNSLLCPVFSLLENEATKCFISGFWKCFNKNKIKYIWQRSVNTLLAEKPAWN